MASQVWDVPVVRVLVLSMVGLRAVPAQGMHSRRMLRRAMVGFWVMVVGLVGWAGRNKGREMVGNRTFQETM